MALLVARHACAAGGTLVVLDPAARFYPPAAAACGIDLRRLLVIRPQRARDALWAWDQALRCPAVKAVWGWLEALDDRWFRRFQLAAEQSGCLGLLLRSVRYRGDPSWSGVQLAVSAGGESRSATDWTRRGDSESSPAPLAGRCLRVEVVRWRGSVPPRSGSAEGMAGTTLRLEERCGHLEVIEVEAIEASCHETPALHLVSELADPTPPGRATGT